MKKETALTAGKRPLHRSNNALLGGVCAGIAEHFDADPALIRIIAVVFCLASLGSCFAAYCILWVLLPGASDEGIPVDVQPESAETTSHTSAAPGTCCFAGASGQARDPFEERRVRPFLWVGIACLFIGFAALVGRFLGGVSWWQFWPLLLVGAGIAEVAVPAPRGKRVGRITRGLVMIGVGAALLPLSIGVLSWSSISIALKMLWPLLLIGTGFCALGKALKRRALFVVGAVFFVAFFVMGFVLYSVPGHTQELSLWLPMKGAVSVDVNPWT